MYTWLIIAGLLLIAELLTGTFYLLMLAIAGVFAWIATLMGADYLAQTLVFLIAAGILVALVRNLRRQINHKNKDKTNPADNLDAGQIIQVTDWIDGVGITHYRGTQWAVVMDNPDNLSLTDGNYRITQLDGTRIRVARN